MLEVCSEAERKVEEKLSEVETESDGILAPIKSVYFLLNSPTIENLHHAVDLLEGIE